MCRISIGHTIHCVYRCSKRNKRTKLKYIPESDENSEIKMSLWCANMQPEIQKDCRLTLLIPTTANFESTLSTSSGFPDGSTKDATISNAQISLNKAQRHNSKFNCIITNKCKTVDN